MKTGTVAESGGFPLGLLGMVIWVSLAPEILTGGPATSEWPSAKIRPGVQENADATKSFVPARDSPTVSHFDKSCLPLFLPLGESDWFDLMKEGMTGYRHDAMTGAVTSDEEIELLESTNSDLYDVKIGWLGVRCRCVVDGKLPRGI